MPGGRRARAGAFYGAFEQILAEHLPPAQAQGQQDAPAALEETGTG